MRTPRRRGFLSALGVSFILSLGLAACDHSGQLAPVPDAPRYGEVESQDGEGYVLLQERIPSDIMDLDVSKLIGIDGGKISLAGHTITVPAGAVTTPTLFTMTLKTTGYIDVDLSATVTDLLGNVIDVGEKGFQKPVTLTLTFARSPNVPDELDDITILRMLGGTHDEGHEPLETELDSETKTVSAELDHFSGYCLADN